MNFTMYTLFASAVRDFGWEIATDIAKSCGCSSIETIDDSEPTTERLFKSVEDAKDARRILENKGLSAACCSVFANLYHSPETISILKDQAENAAALGSPFLHHTLLPWFDYEENLPDFDEAIECAIDAAEEVAKHAEKFGITCLYEEQGFYTNGIENYRIFFDEMKRRCANVGVCGDMGNSLFVDTPAEEFFEAFADDIKHVHAKDYFKDNSIERPGKGWFRSKGGTWLKDAPMGEGIVDIASCMDTLKRIGYRGSIAIESKPIPEAIDYLKKYEFY